MIQTILTLFFALTVQVNGDSHFIFPKDNDIIIPNENYNIQWNSNNNSNVHLQLEIYKNNEWVQSGPNKAYNFLSLIIDKSNTDLTWHVPTLFSDYSQYSSRMKLTNVDTNHTLYSPNFSFMLLTDSPTLSPTQTPITSSSESTFSDFNFLSWWMITIYAVVTAIIIMISYRCYKKNKNNDDY